MSISNISSQSNNLYRQLESLTQSSTANTKQKSAPGQTTGATDGDNSESNIAAALVSAARGQHIDSYA